MFKVEGALPERVWQEAILSSLNKETTTTTTTTTTTELPNGGTSTNSSTLGQWDFIDPMTKSPCTCSKYAFVFYWVIMFTHYMVCYKFALLYV